MGTGAATAQKGFEDEKIDINLQGARQLEPSGI